jgi:hypothetical protein
MKKSQDKYIFCNDLMNAKNHFFVAFSFDKSAPFLSLKISCEPSFDVSSVASSSGGLNSYAVRA